MSTEPREYGIPIIFDVTAPSREAAGEALVEILAGHQLPGNKMNLETMGTPRIESWWTLEGVDKELDRNDNGAGIVLFAEDADYLLRLLNETWVSLPGLDHDRHDRLRRYLRPENRVGWADDETDGA